VLALSLIANIAALRAQEKDAKPADKPAEAAPAAPPRKNPPSPITLSGSAGKRFLQGHRGHHFLKTKRTNRPRSFITRRTRRSDAKDVSQRPISFVYNGGPGFSSVWLHMGSFSPRRVVTVNAGATPPAPYRLAENPQCLLDKTDLVSSTPWERDSATPWAKRRTRIFGGVDQDVKSLAQFINTYVSRNNPLEFAQIPDRRKLRHVSFRPRFRIICNRMTGCTSTASC